MLSLKECKKILNKKDKLYNDEQVIAMRDLVQTLAEVYVNNLNQNDHEQKGSDIYTSVD